MGLTLTTAPSYYPVNLDEAKAHLRVDHADEDTLIEALIAAATEMAEDYTGRSFLERTWTHTRERFENWMELPRGPVTSVTGITYIDSVLYLSDPGGTTVQSPDGYYRVLTLDATEYVTHLDGPIGAIALNIDGEWPSLAHRADAVRIVFKSGYSALSRIPERAKVGIKLLLTHLYEHRGAQDAPLPRAAQAVLQPLKIYFSPILGNKR